jgi:hypothetical protein
VSKLWSSCACSRCIALPAAPPQGLVQVAVGVGPRQARAMTMTASRARRGSGASCRSAVLMLWVLLAKPAAGELPAESSRVSLGASSEWS